MRAFSLQTIWETFRIKVIERKFVQDVGVLTFGNFVSAALNFAQGILVARWLGPELYGVAALVMSYPGVVLTLLDARSWEASVKYLSEFHAKGDRDRVLAMCRLGYMIDLVIGVSAFFIVAVTAKWAADWITHRPEVAGLIVLYATTFIPRAFYGTSWALLASLGKFKLIAWVDILTTVFRVTLIVVLVIAGREVNGVIWGNAIGTAARGLVYGAIAYVVIRRVWRTSLVRFHGTWTVLKERRQEVFRFLIYNNVSAVFDIFFKQLDLVLLGHFRNPVEVGYYRLSKSLTSLVGYLVGPLQWVTYPSLARLSGLGDVQALRRKVKRLALRLGIPLGGTVLAGTLLTPFLLPLFAGQSYSPAVPAAQALLISSGVWLAIFWLRPVYLAQGRIKAWTYFNAAFSCLFILGFFFVVPARGFLGLAVWLMLIQLLSYAVGVVYWRLRMR
jgi:O-antigen/teichoic acid export membrane protein